MPRSIFLGRIPQPGEPLWLQEDRDWALALAEVDADTCPGCGHLRSETTLPENEGQYTAEAIRCHACAGAQKTAAAFAASYSESGTPGAGDGLNWLIRHK